MKLIVKQTRDTLSDVYHDALRIRQAVFVKEQGVPLALEIESPLDEASALHFVAYETASGAAQGTVRLLNGVIQRMAVVKPGRGQGVAQFLLDALLAEARQLGLTRLTLHAQLDAKGFYAKNGFAEVGEVFEEAGIRHITMEKML